MTAAPDYPTLRKEAGFRWYVSSAYYTYYALTNITIHEANTDPAAMVELIKQGRPKFKEFWGDDIPVPGISTPAVSYGHLNALGADLVFPEGGEVNYTRFCDTLDDAINAVSEPVDFRSAGRIPYYLDFREKLRAAFPGENVGFSMGVQGPMTTAYGLRDLDIFTDIYDDPVKTRTLLRRITESILHYKYFLADLDGNARVSPTGHKLYDDVASMFSAKMWEEFVLPCHERYFKGLTIGKRSAHIEDLRPEHLPLLETMGLEDFDAGISHKINPVDLRKRCRVPFGWRMGSFHYSGLSLKEVEEWVYQAVADGASYVFTIVSNEMCKEETRQKVIAFSDASRRVEAALSEGAPRKEIASWVSPEGKDRFWAHWPE